MPRARKLKLFSTMARRIPVPDIKHVGNLAQGLTTGRKFLSPPLLWLAPQGVPRARKLSFFATTDDRAQISQPPPLWLGPQSDHGSAACAETEAFFQYGPPQSFFEVSWLALQKARAREVGATMMTGPKFLRPPLLWLAPQSDHPFSSVRQKARREVGARTDDRAQISQPPPLMARSAIRARECHVRGN